jgi:hypothetical protein
LIRDIVIRDSEAHNRVDLRSGSSDALPFLPISSDGEFTRLISTTPDGIAPELLNAAQAHIDRTGSPLDATALARLAATDPELRRRLLGDG